MKTRIITSLTLIAALVVSGCATAPEDVQASYVSPVQFQAMSCGQLNAEASRVNAALMVATGRQAKAAKNDAGMVAVSLILFWPAAFFVKGDDTAPELARLKGEATAITAAANARGC